MNSYKYYEEIKNDFNKGVFDGKLGYNKILDMVSNCENVLIFSSGELSLFIDDEFTEKVCDILFNKNTIQLKLIFGDTVLAKEDESGTLYNPIIRKMQDIQYFKDRIGDGNYQLYYNDNSLFDRIEDGYIHSIIVDGGKYITLEKPHGYVNDSNEYLYYKENYKVGNRECANLKQYILLECLEPIDVKDLSNIKMMLAEDMLKLDNINNVNEFNIKNKEINNNIIKKYNLCSV